MNGADGDLDERLAGGTDREMSQWAHEWRARPIDASSPGRRYRGWLTWQTGAAGWSPDRWWPRRVSISTSAAVLRLCASGYLPLPHVTGTKADEQPRVEPAIAGGGVVRSEGSSRCFLSSNCAATCIGLSLRCSSLSMRELLQAFFRFPRRAAPSSAAPTRIGRSARPLPMARFEPLTERPRQLGDAESAGSVVGIRCRPPPLPASSAFRLGAAGAWSGTPLYSWYEDRHLRSR